MEDAYNAPAEPQLYILTRSDYDELRSVQLMVTTMAEVIYIAENIENGNTRRMPRYSDIHRFMTDISAQIAAALDGIREDNGIGPSCEAWQ